LHPNGPNLLTRGLHRLGCVIVLALCRSVFLYRRSPGRALALELVLGLGGLKLAAWLAGGSLLGIGLGFWAFFLIQGCWFLIAGTAEATQASEGCDTFDAAKTRALRLLEEV
jgi:hypothetical protein